MHIKQQKIITLKKFLKITKNAFKNFCRSAIFIAVVSISYTKNLVYILIHQIYCSLMSTMRVSRLLFEEFLQVSPREVIILEDLGPNIDSALKIFRKGQQLS
jgi:hypothetical protein